MCCFLKPKKTAKSLMITLFSFLLILVESRRVHAAILVKQFKSQKHFVSTVIVTCQTGGFAVVAIPDKQTVGYLEAHQGTPGRVPAVSCSQSQLVVNQEVCRNIYLQRCSFHGFD